MQTASIVGLESAAAGQNEPRNVLWRTPSSVGTSREQGNVFDRSAIDQGLKFVIRCHREPTDCDISRHTFLDPSAIGADGQVAVVATNGHGVEDMRHTIGIQSESGNTISVGRIAWQQIVV